MFSSRTDERFYDLFDSQAKAANEAANEFHRLALDFSQAKISCKRLEEIEHEADTITHSVVNRINTQFITPMDKEDLHGLTDRLDDITDTIEKAASRIDLYRISEPRTELPDLVSQLKEITALSVTLIAQMRHGFKQDQLEPIIAEIHTSESKMDKAFRRALRALFEDDQLEPRLLIQWKEIYEVIEKAVNRTERLASYVESLMVKYA